MLEIWFFSTPYIELIRTLDWRGVLLRAHIQWLGQHLTHCGIRVNIGGLDKFYTATWNRLEAYDTQDMYKPVYTISIPMSECVISRISRMFRDEQDSRITLKQILYMMYGTPEKVTGMLCTSFVLRSLDILYNPEHLYPDNLYKLLSYASNRQITMS